MQINIGLFLKKAAISWPKLRNCLGLVKIDMDLYLLLLFCIYMNDIVLFLFYSPFTFLLNVWVTSMQIIPGTLAEIGWVILWYQRSFSIFKDITIFSERLRGFRGDSIWQSSIDTCSRGAGLMTGGTQALCNSPPLPTGGAQALCTP